VLSFASGDTKENPVRALCILHDAFSSTGLIGDALRERGWQVDERTVVPAEQYDSPNVDFAFPDHRGYDLLVPLGAPWAAYDDEGVGRWLTPELAWLSGAVADGAAVFGICFGAQALARTLGGVAARSEHPEIGWVTVEPEDAALIAPGPWFEWHYDTFTLPPGAIPLAHNAAATQAYRVGRCLGVQFHPEVTVAGIKAWIDNGGEQECAALGVDPAQLLAEADQQAADSQVRATALVDAYLNEIFPA
jgi:GMP synthase-like glutamine amidotransferase